MQLASPAHGRAGSVQRVDTLSHFVVRPHPLVRLWRYERARKWSTLMAAGMVAAASGYVATAAIVPVSSEVHAVALTTLSERSAPVLVLPDDNGEIVRAPSQLSAAVHEPQRQIPRAQRPAAPPIQRSRRERSQPRSPVAASTATTSSPVAPSPPSAASETAPVAPQPAPETTASPVSSLQPSATPETTASPVALPRPSAAPHAIVSPPPSATAEAVPATQLSPRPPTIATLRAASAPPTAAMLVLHHFEPRVQNLVVRGSLPSALIRRALRRLQPEFAACQNARADVAAVLASSWHTHTAIDEVGRTRDLEVTGPDTARAVSTCLARVTARLVVAAPDTGRVSASWDLRFEPTN